MKTLTSKAVLQDILKTSELDRSFSFDITPYVHIVEYQPEEYIFKDGEYLNHLYFLVKGTVKLYVFHKNGKRSLVDFYSSPCVLGESELLDNTKTAKPLQALLYCTFIRIDTSKCRDLLLNDPVFLRYLCDMMAKKRIYQSKKYINLVSYPCQNTLSSYLLMTAQNGICKEKHTETADYLGISYRHLLFVISDFCQRGFLERTSQGLKIQDYAALKKLADEISDNLDE